MNVGILSTGVYIPQTSISAGEIAAAANIPKLIVEQKLGIKKKPVPSKEDHTCYMGILGAKRAIEKSGIHPAEIDVVIYIGEEYKEYPVWTVAIKLQQEIGAINAWAFDTALRCGTTIMALKLAKSLMQSDATIHTILLAGGYRNGDLVSYKNDRTRFLFNLAAGGGAILLKKELGENLVLGTSLKTDGRFTEDVIVKGGGTKHPISQKMIDENMHMFDVPDPEGMKARLEEVSMKNFLYVIRKALDDSGYSEIEIDYLAILHMKRSAHQYVLTELGLAESQSIYLEEYGHIGQFDQILSLELALESGKVKSGDLVVFVSAGIGYTWGASVIKWGT
ncbi:3-oxoacyl-[acyl-carrier-protein] synthase-3 [Cytobacillus purgationiresistens]|uniref:3-oxoacyl-[acyl-carrier-protein] synthase-3 n=1 Tax=Cytobacillus purgationiresistens TaxID=863449 RepID=A0ABU0ACF5_9BACI|nr:3-oxoacyl-[acyl-carrier-protein] synthase-3 [Cytobacillus purgationiresistens]